MCAIIGVVGENLPPQKVIEKARDVMTHRGPDDAGIYYRENEGIALGHRRLSIIDLSKDGQQPFFSYDKRYTIIFNGEIYNYLELKEELKDKYPFQTKTDTEVLLAAYMTWGRECLTKLRGMFSFTIWDAREKMLFGARDRFGIKPFYYASQDNVFYFASEIKGLLALGIRAQPNEKTIFHYLYYGYYDHSKDTFFESIQSLRPGHFFTHKEGNFLMEKYWDIKDESGTYVYIKTKEDIYEMFKTLLSDSIRLHFRSDVPVGVNLSSGVDSNALLYYAEKVTGSDASALSMCLESEEYDECRTIKSSLSEKHLKRWHTVNINVPTFLFAGKEMITVQDEPYGGIPTILYESLMRLAKEKGVTVLLEGQGVDELLAGYAYYREGEGGIGLSQDRTQEMYADLLHQDFIKKYKKEPATFEEPFDDKLLNMQYRDIYYTKLPRVLRFNDHTSMAYGRELRVPYLDHKFASFMFHLPKEFKIDKNQQKILIREVMKELVPEVIKNKPKKAFGAIQTEWFRNFYKDDIVSILESSSFKARPFWDHKKLKQKVEEFFGGRGENSFFIWQCVNLELWFRKFID